MRNDHAFQRSPCGQKSMMHTSKVDGLQTYYLCQKGYTYQIFMCNDTSPKTYLAKRMLPLHAIMTTLFYTAEKNTIKGQLIISITQPPFSRQRTIMRTNSDSWCYGDMNDRHPGMRYTRGIEVKEGTY